MHYVEVVIAKSRGGSCLYTYATDMVVTPGDIVEVPLGQKSVNGIIVAVVKTELCNQRSYQNILFPPPTSLQLLTWLFTFTRTITVA